jgi:hypothetical protein
VCVVTARRGDQIWSAAAQLPWHRIRIPALLNAEFLEKTVFAVDLIAQREWASWHN